jgi:hypothetical protein
MILKEYDLSVRLPQERAIDTGIILVQSDKDVYKLNARVFDGVNEINYADVTSATITFGKADKNVVQGDMIVEANKLSYILGTNEIACPGKLLVSIQLWGTTERLSTARLVMQVEKDLITENAVQSTSEFPIIQQLKKDLEAIDVVDLTNQFNSHKAESANKAHGGFKSFLAAPSAVTSLADNTITTITFSAPIYNNGFWNAATPNRITIPSGVSKVKVKALASFASNSNGHRLLLVRKNNVNQVGELQVITPAAPSVATFIYGESAVISVMEGDYFEFRVRQTSGGALDLNSGGTWFTLEVVE